MPPEQQRADAPLRWLRNARADLALAGVALPPGGLYEHLCFHAHQAAEKSLKAVLLRMGVEFPFTHNLQALFDLLPAELEVPSRILEAVDLNPYAVSTRYPGEIETVTESDYVDAVRLAEAVTDWAAGIVQHEGPASS
ncbi:MAG TPA: HEPN domain-containing protein [Candidatus Hydrogenedentes bacterium]|nr:HEPN domain-containing protein [Candidatus Hydrogenedentota bacterium]